MQIHYTGYRIRGFYRVAHSGHVWGMTSKHAQHHLAILKFSDRHGKIAASEAFKVSIRTFYRWRQTLNRHAGSAAALMPESYAPQPAQATDHHAGPEPANPPIASPLPQSRQGQAPYAAARLVRTTAISAAERLHHRAHHRQRLAQNALRSGAYLTHRAPQTPDPHAQKPQTQTPPLATAVPDRLRYRGAPARRHPPLFVHLLSTTPAASQPILLPAAYAIALDALTDLLPIQPQYLFPDNGSEFMGDFQQRLDELGITHWWTYPRSPKMNAHCERFNRTIQEQFVDYHADLLFTDLALFNRKVAKWLLEYNTVIPHHSLGLRTPVQFGFQQLPQCQRYWIHTMS